MRSEENTQGLDPSVVTHSVGGAVADETSIDLKVAVRHQGEVLIASPMEVEDCTVCTDESRIVARCPDSVAARLPV